MSSCKNFNPFKKKPEQSDVTGWNYNDKNMGGYQVAVLVGINIILAVSLTIVNGFTSLSSFGPMPGSAVIAVKSGSSRVGRMKLSIA